MKNKEINLVREYLFNQLIKFEEAERLQLSYIRCRESDAVDCFELARAKDNVIMFTQFAKDIMLLLHIVEDNDDFTFNYNQFCEELLKIRLAEKCNFIKNKKGES